MKMSKMKRSFYVFGSKGSKVHTKKVETLSISHSFHHHHIHKNAECKQKKMDVMLMKMNKKPKKKGEENPLVAITTTPT